MSEMHPLDFQTLSDVDKLSRSQAKELLDSCNYLIEAMFDECSEEQFRHAIAVRSRVRNMLGGKQKIKAQHESARNAVVDLLYIPEGDVTPEDYGKAVSGTIEAIKTGNVDIIDAYECIDHIPGFELEWCVIQSFPNVIEKDSSHVKHWEQLIGRGITDAEFSRARALLIDVAESFNFYTRKR